MKTSTAFAIMWVCGRYPLAACMTFGLLSGLIDGLFGARRRRYW